MLELLIGIYCTFAVELNLQKTYDSCQANIRLCIDDHNQFKYDSSMWLDVPDEEMSIESFKECVK